jgi:dTDP-4-dehydrorhamnose 3,5-epimerase
MRIEDTSVRGVKLITPNRIADERGFFTLTWAQDLFQAHELDARVAQRNLSYNHTALTLRGMHYQRAPHAEVKVVSCTAGAIYDVAIDLRPDSPTYCRWFGTELTAETGRVLYIPEGCAHGYVTLEPHCSVEYLVSELYHPESAAGVRWNDPLFGIQWPAQPTVMNDRDRTWPDFEAAVASTRP